jgi:hypothetical protein
VSCSEPIAFARLVDYWAGDLDDDEVDRIDEHLMGCAHCTRESASIARLAAAFRGAIPPIVSADEVRQLAARGLAIVTTDFAPDERKEVAFARGVDLMVHRLGGLALADATRVSVVVTAGPGDDVIGQDDWVPFDRERGELLVACQRHFAGPPADVVFEVHVHRADGEVTRTRYVVPHVYEGWIG